MNKKIIILIATLVVIIGGFTIFANNKNDESGKGPIKIGALLCLTGPCAEWGENSLSGIKLAVEEINEKGGVLGRPLEIVVQDSTEATPASTISAYRNLVSSGIEYIIGPSWTAAGLALAPVASDDVGKVIITSPSLGVAEFNEASDNIFNLWPHDDLATRALAKYAFDNGARNVAIFGSKEAWYQAQSDAFEDEFKKLGGTIIIREDQPSEQKDQRTIALKINAAKPDAVVFTNYDNIGLMSKELKNLGYKNAQYTINLDESRLTQAQGSLEGAVYVTYAPATSDFQDAFEKRYGKKPGITTDNAYDVVYLYAKAIEDSGTSDVEEVNKTLSAYKDFSGASGNVTIDDKGGVEKPAVFWKVESGKFVRLEK